MIITRYNSRLVSVWKFEEDSGNPRDLLGRNNGVAWGGVRYKKEGKYRRCFEFNGLDSYLSVPYDPSFGSITQMVLSLWVKADGPQKGTIIARDDGGSNRVFGLFLDGGRYFYEIFGPGNDGKESAGLSTPHNWDHLVIFYKSQGLRSCYLNGQLVHEGSVVGTLGTGLVGLTVGSRSGSSDFFRGRIDEIMLWNKAPATRSERDQFVSELYKNGEGRFYVNWFQNTEGSSSSSSSSSHSALGPWIPSSEVLSSFDDSLIACWNMEERSGNLLEDKTGLTCTATGAPRYRVQGRTGKGIYFNGSTYFTGTSPGSGILPSGYAPRTLSAWVLSLDTSGTNRYIFNYGSTGTQGAWGLFITSSGYLASGTWTVSVVSKTKVDDGKWHLLTAVYEGVATGKLRLYIDGELDNWGRVYPPPQTTLTSNWKIGANLSNAMVFNGTIDSLMVWKSSLSPGAVRELYRGGYGRRYKPFYSSSSSASVGYWSPNSSLLEKFNGYLVSGYNFEEKTGSFADVMGVNPLTVVGTVYRGIRGKWFSSVGFDGSTGHLSNTSPTGFPTGDRSYTFSLWFNSQSLASSSYVFSYGNTSGNCQVGLRINTNGGLDIFHNGTNLSMFYIIRDGVWYHLAVTYDGHEERVYLNGLLLGTVQEDSLNISGGLYLGRYLGGGSFFRGLIDGFYIWRLNLPPEAIVDLYNQGRGRFYNKAGFSSSSSTSSSSAPSGGIWTRYPDDLAAVYRLEEASGQLVDQTNRYPGTPSPSGLYVQRRYGLQYQQPGKRGYCLGFDKGYITIPNMLSGDFTITAWVLAKGRDSYENEPAATREWYQGKGIVDGHVQGTARDFGVSMCRGKLAFGTGDTDHTLLSTRGIDDGLWHFVAVTRRSSDGLKRVYVDGILAGQATARVGPLDASPILRIGAIATLATWDPYWSGYIDEVTLWTRVLSGTEIWELYR